MSDLSGLLIDLDTKRDSRLRQGKVLSIQTGPPRTLTVDISGSSYTGIFAMDHVWPIIGQGVWLVDIGVGRWLAIGTSYHGYNVVQTVQERDLLSPTPGQRAFVQTKRTEYLYDRSLFTDYFAFHGSAQEYIFTADTAANDLGVTNDVDISVRVAPDTIATSTQMLVTKDGVTAGRSWAFYIASGTMWLEAFPSSSASSTVTLQSVGLVAGTTYWLRATLKVNNGAAGHTTTFYWAPDTGSNAIEPAVWTQLGAAVTAAGTTALTNAAQGVVVGLRPSGAASGFDFPFAGKFYRAILRGVIGGAILNDMNAASASNTSASWVAAGTGETWTTTAMGPGWVIMSEPIQTYVPTIAGLTSPTSDGWYHRNDGFVDFITHGISGGVATGQITATSPMNIYVSRYEMGVWLASSGVNTYIGGHENMAGTSVMSLYGMLSVAAGSPIPLNATSATVPFTWKAQDDFKIKGNHVRMASRYS